MDEEFVKLAGRVVDALSGLEADRFAHQDFREVGVFLSGLLLGQVMSAEAGGIGGERAALTAAGGKAMRAAECDRVNCGWLSHGGVAPIGVWRCIVPF